MQKMLTCSATHRKVLYVFCFFAVALGTFLLTHGATSASAKSTPFPSLHCTGARSTFACYKTHFTVIAQMRGTQTAMEDMKLLYAKDPTVMSQCHQLTHVVGNSAVDQSGGDIAKAFASGDSFCWSGYYHGVVERAVDVLGRSNFIAKADTLCAAIPGKERYSFDYYNCVHGLGHGLMALTKDELFDALALCEELDGSWERSSCAGGVFMENIMEDNRDHGAKYLKKDDLMYPCGAVDMRYKEQCYLMQTSYALKETGYDFRKVFQLCAAVEENFRNTCARSAGRDASGSSVSDIARTNASCALALDDEQQGECLAGAVKDFISYFHDGARAMELCAAAPERFRTDCRNTATTYLSTL